MGGAKIETYKNTLRVVGSMSDVFSAHWQLKVVRATAVGTHKEIIKTLASTTSRFATGASFIGAAVDLMEAGINFSEKDYDAGMAYSASAICGTVLGYGIWFAWSPIGLGALLLAGFGFGIWAVFLEDSPFEQLIKNCPFSKIKSAKAALKGDYLSSINYHLLNNKMLAEKSLKAEWEDYTRFYEDVADIMFSGRVTLDPEMVFRTDAGIGYTMLTTVVDTFKVEVSLGEFIPEYSRLLPRCYLFPNGLENPTEKTELYLSMDANHCHEWVRDKLGQLTRLTANYFVSQEYDFMHDKHRNATILFLFRTLHGKTQGWPIKRNGKDRYMAYKMPVVKKTVSSSLSYGFTFSNLFSDNVRTGTLAELLDVNYWNKEKN